LGAGALPYVEGGHRAIISSRIGGMQMDTILSEGLHFMIPWFQKISSLADLQMVKISVQVLSRPFASYLPVIVLALTVNEVLKFVLATFNASQLITARAQVSLLVLRELFERAEDFNIILEVSITELQHRGGEGEVGVYRVQTSIFFPFPLKQHHWQIYLQEYEHLRILLGVAVTKNPAYLKLRRIRAAQIIAKMVAAPQNKVYLNADSLLLNLQDQTFINK
uniref:Prohibitin n=1 Tax=Mola mola TaxID=94237 RepID=A0A3Q4B1J2_MOLML